MGWKNRDGYLCGDGCYEAGVSTKYLIHMDQISFSNEEQINDENDRTKENLNTLIKDLETIFEFEDMDNLPNFVIRCAMEMKEAKHEICTSLIETFAETLNIIRHNILQEYEATRKNPSAHTSFMEIHYSFTKQFKELRFRWELLPGGLKWN